MKNIKDKITYPYDEIGSSVYTNTDISNTTYEQIEDSIYITIEESVHDSVMDAVIHSI